MFKGSNRKELLLIFKFVILNRLKKSEVHKINGKLLQFPSLMRLCKKAKDKPLVKVTKIHLKISETRLLISLPIMFLTPKIKEIHLMYKCWKVNFHNIAE